MSAGSSISTRLKRSLLLLYSDKSKSKFLSGDNYTIADIGTYPWIARHEWHDIGLKNYKNLSRWYLEISERDAVKKGFSFMNKDEFPPKP